MKTISAFLASALLLAALTGAAVAAGPSEYCFAEADFSQTGSLPDGVLLTTVPASTVGAVRLGSRILRAGDVIPASLFPELRLTPADRPSSDATVVYRPILSGHLAQPTELKIPLLPRTDEAPKASDQELQTYRNMERSGTLTAEDPEGENLTYTIVKEPKRGSVTLDGGEFLYRPQKNKVGKDSFVFTATDSAGNTSNEATVTVEILKPSDKAGYVDMKGDPEQFAATWLKETGVFTGETVVGNLCFCPDKPVTRGEFLAMTMNLLDAKTTAKTVGAAFLDAGETPRWMQPYVATALQNGMIAGIATDGGMVFRPYSAMTKAEAAVMLQNALHLPVEDGQEVFASEAVPAWAERSYQALACAGIRIEPTVSADQLTRRDAAKLLRQVAEYLEDHKDADLPWKR